MRGIWVGGLLGLICWIAIVIVLSSCHFGSWHEMTQPPDVPPEANNPFELRARAGGGDLSRAFVRSTLPVTLAETMPMRGVARILNWGKACQPTGGINPTAMLPSRPIQGGETFPSLFPTVGTAYKCFFLSAADGHGDGTKACWVLWSTELLNPAQNYGPRGFPGCWLGIDTANAVYLPSEGGEQGVFSRRAGEGRVKFEWTFPPEAANRSLFMQTVWITPGQNPGGMLITQPVELWIGTIGPN